MTDANALPSSLAIVASERRIAIYREEEPEPLVVQHAPENRRPFIHPITPPDGNGILTEDAPPHHPWQHGLYVGLNDINGVGFWTEGLIPSAVDRDGTFHPLLETPSVEGNRAAWTVWTEWRGPTTLPMIDETQAWTLEDRGTALILDLDWTLTALTDLRFGEYSYGGLFLRMPYKEEWGGTALNSEGQVNADAEAQRARWVAVTMPLEGRSDPAGMAMMDHPSNPEYPVPWRVDHQLGIAPSRCIAGAWTLQEGETARFRHRLFIYAGEPDRERIEAAWEEFVSR